MKMDSLIITRQVDLCIESLEEYMYVNISSIWRNLFA